MAFGAQELRVLRRALAHALHPSTVRALDDQAVQECVRLADDIDEAVREGARLRAFLVADLARYRAALPGTATGYLALLDDVLGAGYQPDADDLAALRALRGNPRAAVLLGRCRTLAEQAVRDRLAAAAARESAATAFREGADTASRENTPADRPVVVRPRVPVSRTRLLALPGGRTAADDKKPGPRARPPAERPAPAQDPQERPRPTPTPAEVFPPKRPARPAAPAQRAAAG
ncbi:hypothetical protein [Streptomyces silvensis]|uniref:Uncharacterized protein n=1 Tax=Streptomyces silvensis TaxID=1765722 RepID=A0A0W7WYH7_9ACTN|nr:hypothetical protein [Streptomyces silvensis]KUF15575.1 hypothetical protein AT728_26400 [Streptomyces silvensis]